MKIKKTNDKNGIMKACAFCEKATVLAEENYVLCSKKGIVSQTYSCRGFAYDPLKKDPKRMPAPLSFEEISDELPEV